MSSLKMTFSLTSLIFLIAFGLVFTPTAVMAHDASQLQGGDGTDDDVGPHTTHPVKVAVTAVPADSEAVPPTPAILAIPVHGAHPTVSISLKDGGTETVVTSETPGTTDVVTLVVQFNMPVAATASQMEINANDLLQVGDFTIAIRDSEGMLIPDPVSVVGTVVRTDATTGAKTTEFVVPFTIDAAAIPSGTSGEADEKFTLKIKVNEEAVFGLQQTLQSDDGGFTDIEVGGGASQASAVAEFTLVQTPTPPPVIPDTTPPTVTVEAPNALDATDGTAVGTAVFTITFSEELSTAAVSGFAVEDIIVIGGMVTDLSGPAVDDDDAQMPDVYMLTVTPDDADGDGTPDDGTIMVSIGNQILDTANNQIDLAMGTPSASVLIDMTPPTVLSHSSMEVEAPTGAPAGDYLAFTFTFDEAVTMFTVNSIDQGSSHNIGRLATAYFGPTDVSGMAIDPADATAVYADNSYQITVPISDTAGDTTIVLTIGNGAIEDMHDNALVVSYTATHLPANTAPVFEDPAPTGLMWCEAEMKGSILLPKARDTEGDELTYSLSPALPENPATPPTAGLYWVTIDAETRYLRGTAQVSDAGTYTWTVTDEHGATNATPMTFTIVVTPYAVPIAVTDVAAVKVDSEARVGDDVDKVKLTWTDPNPTTYPNATCIPAVTSYTVTMQELNTHTQGRTPKGQAIPMSVTIADGDPLEYTTDELGHGTYEFTVTAVNRAGNSPVSDKAIWDKTMYHWVIVNDPPDESGNLRANQTEQPAHSVTLDWIPPTDDPNAPVNDGETGLAMELYGVDTTFGGYHVEVTDQSDGAITIHKDPDGTLIDGDQRTHHITGLDVGEYTCRIVAWNVVGAGALSESQDFEIDVYQAAPEDPTNTAPTFADGAEIASIVATVGTPISGRFLPQATDADGDALTYSIEDEEGMETTSPGGLTFNPANRALTGESETAMSEMAYTYKVTDGTASATIGFFITVKAAREGPPPTSTVTTSLPANGYIVYVRDIDNPPHFGTSNPAVAEWADMPNLYELFTQGGGGSLQLTVTADDVTADDVTTDDVTNIGARQVVFSEVMWAVDEGQVGQDGYDANQWLELRNRTANAIPISSISFVTKDGRPALAQGTDLISNVVGGGDAWIRTKGQNGNSGAADGSGQKEFISMHRKRYHNDSAGWNGGEWVAATEVYHPNHRGTPGIGEPKGVQTFSETSIPLTTVFNEIGNYPSGNSDHEWIELRIRSGDPNFKNWVVHMVTGASDRDTATNPTQAKLFQIPELNKGRYDDILLITKTDPARDDDHPLRGGYNVKVADADQDNEGRDKNIRYYVADDWNTDLPDNGEFVLILRHGNDKTNHEKIQDIAGYHPNLKVETASFFSNLWPLRGYPAPNIALNKIEDGAVHRRQKDGIAGTRTTDKKDNADHVALRDVGWTGIGYKRNANAGAQNGGTPGYPNGALQSNETQAGADPVIISEIMYSTGERGNITQWIELRNTSQTVGVNLDGWRVRIVNHDQDNAAGDKFPEDLVKDYGINGKIPPGQTFLIVAHSGTDNTNLPSERIEAIRRRRGDVILSQYGFEITLETKEKDGKRKEADKVGNLAASTDARVRGNPQSYEDPEWSLPLGMNDDGDRISIVRVSESGGVLNGQLSGAWKSFDMSAHVSAPESTYYGNRNDLSSPGYTVDGVLPVSLSKFRPERMKDTGEIVVRWVTESETNNAGFNILRGEAIDGEFTKLQFVAGQGTTSERTTYEYADKSAKPNVVYYYQIQDVSLDGQVTTLRTTHLRGNVTAAGKLTTTWGELKALQ